MSLLLIVRCHERRCKGGCKTASSANHAKRQKQPAAHTAATSGTRQGSFYKCKARVPGLLSMRHWVEPQQQETHISELKAATNRVIPRQIRAIGVHVSNSTNEMWGSYCYSMRTMTSSVIPNSNGPEQLLTDIVRPQSWQPCTISKNNSAHVHTHIHATHTYMHGITCTHGTYGMHGRISCMQSQC